MSLLRKMINTNTFASKVFIAIFCCTIIPFYIIFSWIKYGYEEYMKNEYCKTMTQMIANGEENINSIFDKMANLSNIIVFDRTLIDAFAHGGDYYENNKIVDRVISQLIINNFINMDDLMITIFDQKGRIYTNWTTGYDDYTFLLEREWVKSAKAEKGHIFWDFFSPGYVKGDESEKYISLARSIYSNGVEGNNLGVVIISVRQEILSEILRQYLFDPTDCVYICDPLGKTILSIDENHIVNDVVLESAIKQTQDRKNVGTVLSVRNEEYLVSTYEISKLSVLDLTLLRVVQFTNYSQIEAQVSGISGKMNIYLVIGFLISVVASVVIAKFVVRPINLLARQMDTYSLDETVDLKAAQRKDEIGQLNRSYMEMSRKIKKLFDDLNHEYEIKEQYRYESLRAKINPHFLFNTLNAIRWMAIIRKADNITEMIDALAGMLSYSMSKDGEIVLLKQELENIKNYVFIQNCRYGEKYLVEIDIEEELQNLKVVRFILQPIVENAMHHAFKNFTGVGRIHIYAQRKQEILYVYVEDNGNGMTKAQVQQLLHQDSHKNKEKFTGIGYAHVNERIRVAYGQNFGLDIESCPGKGVKVIYTLPVIN